MEVSQAPPSQLVRLCMVKPAGSCLCSISLKWHCSPCWGSGGARTWAFCCFCIWTPNLPVLSLTGLTLTLPFNKFFVNFILSFLSPHTRKLLAVHCFVSHFTTKQTRLSLQLCSQCFSEGRPCREGLCLLSCWKTVLRYSASKQKLERLRWKSGI